MPSVDENATFDIMLSPQFYIYKHEDMPIRFEFQAKKLAPSILEDLLPKDDRYEYFVFKEGDGWGFVAFNTEEISAFLQSHNIMTEKVSKLYFAQQSAVKFEIPVSLDENEALANLRGTVTVIPKALLSEDTPFQDFSEDFKPSAGKSFGAGMNSVIGEKESWIIAAILLIFAMMFAAEGFRYSRISGAMEARVQKLLSDHPSLQSKYARENIAKKYRKIDKEERHKREVLKKLSRLLLPGVELQSLLVERGRYSATFKSPDEKTVLRLLTLAKAKQFKAVRSGSDNIVKIEGKL